VRKSGRCSTTFRPWDGKPVSQGCRPRALKGNENQPLYASNFMTTQKTRLHATLTAEKDVRHLLIAFMDDSHVTNLVQLSGGSEVQLATGTQYKMGRKADEWACLWETNEGFKRLPAGKPAFESLELTIALAKRMGFTVLRDERYKTGLNLKGEVSLGKWQGMTPKNGGGYVYALDRLHIRARPTLPPDHPLNRIHPGKCSIDGSLGLRVGYLVCLAA
jgi:hypothetical protein